MKSIFYILATTITLVNCQKENTANSIISEFETRISNSKSWEYNVHYKMKYFSSDKDTLNYYSNCRLIKHKSDNFFGGSFWIKNDSIDNYYDLENIYIIDHNNKKITKFFPEKGQDKVIRSNTGSGVLNSYFLKPNRLSKYLQDSTIVTKINDTIIDKKKLNTIEFKFEDDAEFYLEKQRKIFYFNKNNALKDIIFSVKSLNEWQYNEWHFSSEKYNTINDKTLKSEFDSLKKTYTIENYKVPDTKKIEPLATGIKSPLFNGLNFQKNDSIKLSNYEGKYIILDFWYKDCFPCTKAITSLNKLRIKYSENDLVILGINPYDTIEKDKEKLEKFIEITKMNYPAILVDNKVKKAYNIKVFPTFYILDTSGKIVYSKVGYTENSEKEIDSLLNMWIK